MNRNIRIKENGVTSVIEITPSFPKYILINFKLKSAAIPFNHKDALK